MPTPGSVADGQLVDSTQPEPEPAPEPDPDPGDPGVPEQGQAPTVDPDLPAPILQATEVAPDPTHIDGPDAHETIQLDTRHAATASHDPLQSTPHTTNSTP